MFQSYVFNSPSSVAAGFADSSGNTFTLAALGPTGSAIVNVTTTVDATAAMSRRSRRAPDSQDAI